MKIINSKKGFTVVELIVSLALFITVSLVSVGALLSIVGANKKTQSIKSVTDNLSFAVESISKSARVGNSYHCEDLDGGSPSNISTPLDCSSGGDYLAFEGSSGDSSTSNDQIVFKLNNNQIERSTDGGSTFISVTAPEVSIGEGGLRFFVLGAPDSDGLQPRILIVVRGTVSFSNKATTDFNIQTSVSQRLPGS